MRPVAPSRTCTLVSLALLAAVCGLSAGSGGRVCSPLPSTPSPSPAPLTRIMPLGDSITQADSRHDSYRRALWMKLQADATMVDFVGSQTANSGGSAPSADFDCDHEGHWGWTVDQILTRLRSYLSAHQPDILLVHLGTNDVLRGHTNASTLTELESIIDTARAVDPSIVILLGQIITTTDPAASARILELNAGIAALAIRRDTSGSAVRAVDHASGFDPARQTYDGLHPNAIGEEHLASRWYAALAEFVR